MKNKKELQREAENIATLMKARELIKEEGTKTKIKKEIIARIDYILIDLQVYMNEKETREYGDMIYKSWLKITKEKDWVTAYSAYHKIIRPILID